MINQLLVLLDDPRDASFVFDVFLCLLKFGPKCGMLPVDVTFNLLLDLHLQGLLG